MIATHFAEKEVSLRIGMNLLANVQCVNYTKYMNVSVFKHSLISVILLLLTLATLKQEVLSVTRVLWAQRNHSDAIYLPNSLGFFVVVNWLIFPSWVSALCLLVRFITLPLGRSEELWELNSALKKTTMAKGIIGRQGPFWDPLTQKVKFQRAAWGLTRMWQGPKGSRVRGRLIPNHCQDVFLLFRWGVEVAGGEHSAVLRGYSLLCTVTPPASVQGATWNAGSQTWDSHVQGKCLPAVLTAQLHFPLVARKSEAFGELLTNTILIREQLKEPT